MMRVKSGRHESLFANESSWGLRFPGVLHFCCLVLGMLGLLGIFAKATHAEINGLVWWHNEGVESHLTSSSDLSSESRHRLSESKSESIDDFDMFLFGSVAPQTSNTSEEESKVSIREQEVEKVAKDRSRRAQQIEALMNGSLDPQVDERGLFQIDLHYLLFPDVVETGAEKQKSKAREQTKSQLAKPKGAGSSDGDSIDDDRRAEDQTSTTATGPFNFLRQLAEAVERSESIADKASESSSKKKRKSKSRSRSKKNRKTSTTKPSAASMPSAASNQKENGNPSESLRTKMLESETNSSAGPLDPRSKLRQSTIALQQAYLNFFSLPIDRQQALLERHANRRELAEKQSRGEEELRARVEATEMAAKHLEDFIEGKLDSKLDPRTLFGLSSLDAQEWLRSPTRLKRILELIGATSTRTDLGSTGGSAKQTAPKSVPSDIDGGSKVDQDEESKEQVDSKGSNGLDSASKSGVQGDSSAPGKQLISRLETATLRLDRARVQYMKLAPADRAGLWTLHRKKKTEASDIAEAEELSEDPEESESQALVAGAERAADEASRARKAALEAAKRARSEAIRVVAEERARLLGVTERQERFAISLSEHKEQWKKQHEQTLEWHRKVADLASRENQATINRDADLIYFDLRSTLEETREQMRRSLSVLRDFGRSVPRAGNSELSGLPSDVDRKDLNDLREKIESRAAELEVLEESIGWEITEGLRDDIVLLNQDRLKLLELGSSHLRDRVTALSKEGIVQVGNEVEQIVLEIYFRARSFSRVIANQRDELLTAPIPFVFALIKLTLLIVTFRWWRSRAEKLLSQARIFFARSRRSTRLTRAVEISLWYLARIRKPLEWLIFWALIFSYGEENSLESELVWIVLLWTLGGSAIVLFVDALATREMIIAGRGRGSSKLRIESLRLVNVVVVAVGLILGLTEELVGRGAIYAWVWQTCWLLIVPTILRLIHRWRETIFARVARGSLNDPVYKWVQEHQNGWVSFVAACVGGAYMFGTGFGRWIVRQLSGLDATRRFLAYLFRREVAQQAKARANDNRYQPIDASNCRELAPEYDCSQWIESIAAEELNRVRSVVASPMLTMSAVVGERGRGKSVFLKRLAAAIDQDRKSCVVSCPPRGWSGLMDVLRREFGADSQDMSTLAQVAQIQKIRLICVDDVQHLMRQSVGGLDDLDRFIDFAQHLSSEISWVVALDSVSWNYLIRARGDKVFFDQVTQLPRWSEEQIRLLVQNRTKACGISPRFDDLVVPRQINSVQPGAEGSIAERTERGYYRIVWDHANGNAAVALHVWRASLFQREDRPGVVVRLFSQPSAEEIENLGLSMLFVLRAIVQVDFAMVSDIVACTQLPLRDVADALRFSISHGYVELVGDRYRISWDWYRTITVVLSRQHLLVS